MNRIKYILFSWILLPCFFSCEQDVEPVINEDAKPRVTATASVAEINESGSPTFDITISFDKPIKTTTSFSATKVGGDASDSDFEVSQAIVPAYQKSGTMTVTVLEDIDVEGTETLELQIEANNTPDIYEVVGSPTVSVNIQNTTSTDFLMRLEWDDIYLDADEHEHHFCDYDLDLELLDSSFNPVRGSYNDCPEEIRLSPGSLPDGDYYIVPEFWTNDGAVPPPTVLNIPANIVSG